MRKQCAFHSLFCTDLTNFGGSTVASSVSNIMQLYQQLPGLLSYRDSSGVGQVVFLPITLEADSIPGRYYYKKLGVHSAGCTGSFAVYVQHVRRAGHGAPLHGMPKLV